MQWCMKGINRCRKQVCQITFSMDLLIMCNFTGGFVQISLCSELQGGSIPPDESSNEMLLVVDEPRDSTPPAVPLDPPAAVEPQQGNASKARPFVRNRGRAKASEKARGRKSAGTAAAMAGAMAGAAAASAAAYAAYGYNITQSMLIWKRFQHVCIIKLLVFKTSRPAVVVLL
uniref:Uncharacterized protein n=1 Tax=Eptatretus burgeri TaxID=7764 RepID=A0A8C4QKW5_EPTBU